jgi:outer membrane protein assembly factor BamB
VEAKKPIDAQRLDEVAEGFILRLKPDREDLRAPTRWKSFLLGGLLGLVSGGAAFLILSFVVPHRAGVVEEAPVVEPVPLREGPRRPVTGLLQFRGNPTHTYYGEGPLPAHPRLLWRFPRKPMCSESRTGEETKIWWGTGWTGQPVVWERPDGVSEVIVGAFDRAVHFIDAETGRRTRRDFRTGDIIKGTVTLDPDGDPLLYFGSRDNKLRILALDRPRSRELWSIDAGFVPGMWNDDWDSNPVVENDILYEGGENGYLFAFRLHRDYDQAGMITVAPELLLAFRGWTEELLSEVGDRNVSIENSVAVFQDRLYFANSAGRVVGLDISRISAGRAPVVFDYWVGDDVDASIVVDEEGMLYVAVELERFLPRSEEMGQLLKLDPSTPEYPVVWSLPFPPSLDDYRGGIWSTPALAGQVLFVTTHSGMLTAVDKNSGQILFIEDLGPHAWSSPVVVGENLLVATCTGEIRNYSIADPARPMLHWSVRIPTKACIESTPAVWKGRVIVGARDGFIYAFGD